MEFKIQIITRKNQGDICVIPKPEKNIGAPLLYTLRLNGRRFEHWHGLRLSTVCVKHEILLYIYKCGGQSGSQQQCQTCESKEVNHTMHISFSYALNWDNVNATILGYEIPNECKIIICHLQWHIQFQGRKCNRMCHLKWNDMIWYIMKILLIWVNNKKLVELRPLYRLFSGHTACPAHSGCFTPQWNSDQDF